MSIWWFFHGFFHGFPMAFPKIFRPFYVTMVSKKNLRLEGVFHRQPNATWEGKNFDVLSAQKKETKKHEISLFYTILVYFSRILCELLSIRILCELLSFWWFFDIFNDEGKSGIYRIWWWGKTIMFILPIIHQHSPEKSLEHSVDLWGSVFCVWKVDQVDPSRMLRLPDIFHLPDVLTKTSWRENRPKQKNIYSSWWAKKTMVSCKLSRTKPVHGRIQMLRMPNFQAFQASFRSQGAIQSRDHWTLHHLKGCPEKNSHTNGRVWKSIAYHLAYHKNGEHHAKIC